MSKMTFIVGFKKDEECGLYVTKVLNLPGCMSQGKTLEEAKANTVKAINACLIVWNEEFKSEEYSKFVPVSTPIDSSNRFALSC